MAEDDAPRHKRSRERDPERKAKKRSKHEDRDSGRKHKRKRRDSDTKLQIVDDDPNDDDMWVEKNIDMDGERASRLSNVFW